MKKVLAAFVLVAAASSGAWAQGSPQFSDYLRTLLITPGLQVSVVHLNEVTLPVVFQPPTIYVMRARTHERTLVFVQGTTEREVDFDPDGFVLEQDGQSGKGQTLNINNFKKGKVPNGRRIDGIVEFTRKVDLSKPFTVRFGGESAVFAFSDAQMHGAAAPPAAP